MIINSFDNSSDAILNPSQLSPKIENFPEVAVVAFSEQVIKVLHKYHNPEKISDILACVNVPIYKTNFQGADIAVYCSTLGGSAAAMLLEEMISKGCKKFIFFGSCGVLNQEITEKSLIVPTAAYRDEGTSYHYAPASEYIEVKSANRLAEILYKIEVPYICGKTWTTDALYRETYNNIEKRKNDGCITVDMESASIMAVADFRSVDVYQFFYAADSLDGTEWDARDLGSLKHDSFEKFLRVALEIATRI